MSRGRSEEAQKMCLTGLSVFLKTWSFTGFFLCESGRLSFQCHRGLHLSSMVLYIFILWTFAVSLSLCLTFLDKVFSVLSCWRSAIKPKANDTHLRTFILKRGLCFGVNILTCFLTFPSASWFWFQSRAELMLFRGWGEAVLRARH